MALPALWHCHSLEEHCQSTLVSGSIRLTTLFFARLPMNFWLTANLISSEQSPSHLQSCRLWPLAKTGKNRSPFLFRRFLRRLMKIKIDYFISRQSNIWFLTAICFAIAVLQVTIMAATLLLFAFLAYRWRCRNSLLSIVIITQHCNHCWECLYFGAEYYTKNWDLMYVKLNFRGFEFSYFRLNSTHWIARSVWIAVLDLKSIFSLVNRKKWPKWFFKSLSK